MCGRPWSQLLGRPQGLSKIICLGPARLVGAQNAQMGNCARLDQIKHSVDQIGRYVRARSRPAPITVRDLASDTA